MAKRCLILSNLHAQWIHTQTIPTSLFISFSFADNSEVGLVWVTIGYRTMYDQPICTWENRNGTVGDKAIPVYRYIQLMLKQLQIKSL